MEKVYKIGFFVMGGGFLVLIGLLVGRGYFSSEGMERLTERVMTDEGEVEEGIEEKENIEVEVSPTVSKVPTVEVKEEDEDLESIFALAFEEKFNKQAGTAEVTISKIEDEHVSGGIRFVGDMGGGWFLGAKDGDVWVIVADGNGTVDCAKIEPYDFSTEMVPECWDETTMTLIER